MFSGIRAFGAAVCAVAIIGMGCPNPAANDDAGGQPATDAGGRDAAVGPIKSIDLTGAVQKGPFVSGSTIAVSLLDGVLNPTGQVFNAATSNNLGEFSIHFEAGGPVAIEGVGYYYNEVLGTLSSSTLTLRALYIPQSAGVQNAYVNLITHLTIERVKSLVSGGAAFSAAVAQAETELRSELAVSYSGFSPNVDAIRMNVVGGDDDNNAYLLGVSSVLIQVAVNRGGSVDARVQELLNGIALDFGDGTLESALKTEIADALLDVDVAFIATKLGERLVETGSSASVPDMNRVLDQDRDGIKNIDDNCSLIANPGQENVDGDARGDACDLCPSTLCAADCLPTSQSGLASDLCYTACAPSPLGNFQCAGGSCAIVNYLNNGQPATHQLCAATCDPTTASPCDSGFKCVASQSLDAAAGGGRAFGCVPDQFAGQQAVGDACGGNGECGEGLACGAPPDFPFSACRQACTGNAAICNGTACIVAPSSVNSSVSLCELPPGQLGDACVAPDGHVYTGPDTCDTGLACIDRFPTLCSPLNACCMQAGALDQPCRTTEPRCDGVLECIMAGGAGPSGEEGEVCREVGALGQPCRQTEPRCDGLLECHWIESGEPPRPSEQCVQTGVLDQPCRQAEPRCDDVLVCAQMQAGGEQCKESGDQGEPCNADGSCNGGLGCINDSGACANYVQCCLQAGAADQPCRVTQPQCDTGLACAHEGCAGGASSCCVDAGGLDQPCIDNQFCDDGFYCAMDPMSCPSMMPSCCKPAGGLNQPCDSHGNCNAGLGCITQMSACGSSTAVIGCCVTAANLGQACGPTTPCNGAAAIVCASGLAECSGVGGVCCVAERVLGAECSNQQICGDGLRCLSSTQTTCTAGFDSCCVQSGGPGEPCNVDNSCDTSGYQCVAGTCLQATTHCVGSVECGDLNAYVCVSGWCMHGGALGEPCLATSPACSGSLICQGGSGPSDPGSCVERATAGEACEPSQSICEVGLSCIPATGFCQPGDTFCCVAPRTVGEECWQQPICGSGQRCIYNHRTCPAGTTSCCVTTGAQGEPCNGTDPQCDSAGLACISGICWPTSGARCSNSCALGYACLDTYCVAAGGLNEPCENYACDTGDLVCERSAGCVFGDTCCTPAGAQDQPCRMDAPQCNDGFACVDQMTYACPGGMMRCCTASGGLGEPCNSTPPQCDSAANACLRNICVASEGIPCPCTEPEFTCIDSVCAAAGGLLEPCKSGNVCDDADNMVCRSAPSCYVEYQNCCTAAGGDHQACRATGEACDSGRVCVASGTCGDGLTSCCLPAGDAGEPCLVGQTCNGELACVTWDQNACSGMLECCLDVGGLNQPCRQSTPRCDGSYTCQNQYGICPNQMFECCM